MPDRIAVVLAAGKGTRMVSSRPKVLHEAAGRPLLAWVLQAARQAGCTRILVVVGHGAEEVKAAFTDEATEADDLTWVLQAEQRGTGHALAQVEPYLIDTAATLLVLSGDVPLVTPETLERLARLAEPAETWGAMAVAEPADPGALGRVIAENSLLRRIVEARDASPEERNIRRINAGLYALPAPEIFSYLSRLKPQNAQGELYLTDALSAAAAEGRIIRLLTLADPEEALGVNNQAELAEVHRRLLARPRP